MDLDRWVKVFDGLLPRSSVWGLVVNRTIRKFFHGLSILPQTIHAHLSSILLEAFPAETTRLEDWSNQFGAFDVLSRSELDAEWGAFGGQSPYYIQNLLRDAGFDVYVHEWWVPGSDPVTARNPFSPDNLIDTSYVLVNDLYSHEKNYSFYFGKKTGYDQFKSDGSVYFGAYDGYHQVMKKYPCPNDPDEYPVYWYVCGQTWPDYVYMTRSEFRKLVRLIYKVKPVHTRVILRAIVDGDPDDYDIQDTWYDDDIIYDEITSVEDDLQDMK